MFLCIDGNPISFNFLGNPKNNNAHRDGDKFEVFLFFVIVVVEDEPVVVLFDAARCSSCANTGSVTSIVLDFLILSYNINKVSND